MKDEEKRLADAEQKSERRRIQEENVRRKEAAKVKEVKAQERVCTKIRSGLVFHVSRNRT